MIREEFALMAKHVDFLSTLDGGSQEVVLTITVNDGQVVPVGDSGRPVNVAEMVDLVQRLPGYEGVTPADGDKFLAALHMAYSGSRFRATKPYEPPAA
jgi:hypothetical protein